MTKKHFIALADKVIYQNTTNRPVSSQHVDMLADFCQSQNPNFNRDRWLSYIAGECGKSGGKVKQAVNA